MIFKIIYRTVFFYILVVICYKIMGKREVGQLSIIDFIVSLLISELIATGIENYKDSIWYVIVPILILTFFQVIISIISLKSTKARQTLDGKESVIIENGKLNFKEMVKQRYNLSDLLVQLREKSIKTIETVDYAILETNGKLSIFEKKDKKDNTFPLPLVVDGVIEKNNLKYINKDLKWIKKTLFEKSIKLDEVFYAFYKNKELYIIKK